MTDKEALKRVKNLDIRDAEPDDYAALYTVIQLAEKFARTKEISDFWNKLKEDPFYD